MQELDVGEIATITTDWYDKDGNAAEPSAINLTLHLPDNSTLVRHKADFTGGSSAGNAPVLDEWVRGEVVTQAGLWRGDLDGTVDGSPVKLPSLRWLVGARQRTGPCEPWCTWEEVTDCIGLDSLVLALVPAQREACIDYASELLWNLTGRVYSGICETTRSLCFGCMRCWPSRCGCAPLNGVDLGGPVGAPVWGVWDVTVDDKPLIDTTTYRVTSRRWLVRDDGQGWPSGWNVADVNSFRASWAYGRRVPVGGRRSAAIFAGMIARTCPPAVCSLPDGTTTLAAEGVVYNIDPSVYASGHTGIALVDEWIAADAKGRKSPPRLYHPASATGLSRLPQ